MIHFRSGNLLDSPAVALVNTVNTVGVMGKGIALQFRSAFPHNFVVYKRACEKREVTIGKILAVSDRDLFNVQKLILNMPTKTHWRLPSEFTYVRSGLITLREVIIFNNIISVAMPIPGCGNGGLDRHKVQPMLETFLGDLNCDIFVHQP